MLLSAAVIMTALLDSANCRVIEKKLPTTFKEMLTPVGVYNWLDYITQEFFGVPLTSPAIRYKGKHEDNKELKLIGQNPAVAAYRSTILGHPRVQSSLEIRYKNNMILITSIGAVFICWFSGFVNVFIDNDAGAFFVDCLTMWTQFVYFYKDERSIQYSYV